MDIIDLLEDYGIEYWKAGSPNVSKGWVGIECPFCDDTSNHLGINIKSLAVRCWKCGKHRLTDVLKETIGLEYNEAKDILKVLEGSTTFLPEKPPEKPRRDRVVLPSESSKTFPNLHYNYLKSRGLQPRKTIRKFDLRACHKIGTYKFRIIIPIYLNNRLIYFTSRTVMPNIKPTYKDAPKNQCMINSSGVIYNYDSLRNGCDAFAVEGPVDVWKLGDGSFGTLGAEVSIHHLTLLLKKKIRTLYILSEKDQAGRRWASRMGRALGPVCKSAEIITLDNKKDAGDLTLSEVISLKKSIGFKYE